MKGVNHFPMHHDGLKISASSLSEFMEFGSLYSKVGAKIATSMQFKNVYACRSAVWHYSLNHAGTTFYGVGKQS